MDFSKVQVTPHEPASRSAAVPEVLGLWMTRGGNSRFNRLLKDLFAHVGLLLFLGRTLLREAEIQFFELPLELGRLLGIKVTRYRLGPLF